MNNMNCIYFRIVTPGGVVIRRDVAIGVLLLVFVLLILLVAHEPQETSSMTRPPAPVKRNTNPTFDREMVIRNIERLNLQNQSLTEILTILKSMGKMKKLMSDGNARKHAKGIPIRLHMTPAQTTPQSPEVEGYQETIPHKVQVFGELKPAAKYAVYGCMYPRGHNVNYAFYLPLTARAWKRIGFESIAVLTGTYERWQNSTLTKLVVDNLKNQAVIVFLDTTDLHSMLVSQISRMFMASVLDWKDRENYIISSDADLWPLADATYYHLYPGKHILSLNAMCCGHFDHRGRQYRMLPMANIGMNVTTWRQVLKTLSVDNNFTTCNEVATARDMVDNFRKEFGGIVDKPYNKGSKAWFLDQKMLSVRIDDFLHGNGRSYMQMVPRQVFMDRIDRGRWLVPDTLDGIVDTHLPYDGFKDKPWATMVPLIRLMYPEHIVAQLQTYKTDFYHLFKKLPWHI